MVDEASIKNIEMMTTTEDDIKGMIQPRPRDAHKGTCGRVLIVAGQTGMAGAAILSARAALRAGAGLVSVAVPVYLFHIIQTAVPEATCIDVRTLTERSLNIYDAIAFGPGVGCTADRYRQLEHILLSYRGTVVIDADGINSLCEYGWIPVREGAEEADKSEEDMQEELEARSYGMRRDAFEAAVAAGFAGRRRMSSLLPDLVERHRGAVILTPHPGEADRLLEALEEPAYGELTREAAAEILARRTGAVVVLKGAGTLVAAKEEEKRTAAENEVAAAAGEAAAGDAEKSPQLTLYRNPTGNPGMATGGSGDVLTGITAALAAWAHAGRVHEAACGRPDCAMDVARCAVYLHGLAGDLAAQEIGEFGMTAADIVQALPQAFRMIAGR